MDKYDFRMNKFDDIPVMTEDIEKYISQNIGNRCYTNSNQKYQFIVYILENLTNKCAYCGLPLEIHTVDEIDHFIPKTPDNENDIKNLVITCRKCNRSKSNSVFSKDLYPYARKYSDIFTRGETGNIVSAVNEEEYIRFANEMKFNSIYYSITYIVMLIDTYQSICNDTALYKELNEFSKLLKQKAKVWDKEEKI